MAGVDGSTGLVIPAGFYTAKALLALTPARQAAAQGAQALLDARQSLLGASFSDAWSGFSVRISGAASPGGTAAQTGLAAQEESRSRLLDTLTETGGYVPTSLFQLNLLQAFTRQGVTVGTATTAAAEPAAASATPAQSYLATVYGRNIDQSLTLARSAVGNALSAWA